MENIDSPSKPIPLNLPVRNVLKELNNLEAATKSPKQAVDHPENYTKDQISLSKIVPDIVTNVDADNIKAVNRNLLHVTTPTDVQSSDDEYADCNTTFKSSVSSPVKNTFDATSVLNKTVEILEKENSTSPNESNDANVTVCVSNQKLNLGFVENRRSEIGDLETVKSAGGGESLTENRSKDTTFSSSFTHDAAAIDQNSTVVIHQCIDEPSNKLLEVTADLLKYEPEEEVHVTSSECIIESNSANDLAVQSENVTTIESELAIELKIETESEHENNSHPNHEQRTEPQIIVESNHIIESESVVDPDTVAEPQPVNKSEPAEKPLHNETETIIQSESVSESEPVIESTPAVTVDELSTPTCGSQGNVSFDVHEKVLQTTDEGLSTLNETRTLPEATSSCQQDATFISKSDVNNETVLVESSPTKSHDKLDSEEIITATDPEGLINGTQLQKIREFKANQAVSADSLELDGETRDCSLDSLEMKPNEPSTPTDKCPPIDTAGKLFSSRKAPNFSEMFPNSTFTTDGSNDFILNKPCDKKSANLTNEEFGNQQAINGDTFNSTVTLSASDKAPLLMEEKKNYESALPDFPFKPPSVPSSTTGKPKKQQENVNDSNFMVLNSNDFDFLQSRGANSVSPEDDRRSSLLLRFDPLAGRSVQSKPSVQVIEESKGDSLTSSTSSDQNGSVANQTTNEQPSNGTLVEVAMDSNSFMSNVKIEKNGDKIISVDGVLLTNKKIDISSVDENIRKKMEEYEATQEMLLKRLAEKDKAITKTSNVLELYEKGIAEALAAKEKLSQTYEKEQEELKTDRDVNFQHLLSLESTFADLHMKFERNVQYTAQLQEKLNTVADEKSKAEELLKQQEFRYDKMKGHTMQQFDIANAKLEQQSKTISMENTKLKAQIKREEIHKNAVAEELSQKKRENEELVKICDELISGQRS